MPLGNVDISFKGPVTSLPLKALLQFLRVKQFKPKRASDKKYFAARQGGQGETRRDKAGQDGAGRGRAGVGGAGRVRAGQSVADFYHHLYQNIQQGKRIAEQSTTK